MNEKAGGAHHPQSQMEGFYQEVNSCYFQDLGYYGLDFTWSNMKEGSHRILLRLNRAFATSEWLKHFRDPKVHHLAKSTFDHYILTIADSPPKSIRVDADSILRQCGPKEMIAEKLLNRLGAQAPFLPLPKILHPTFRDVS